MQYDFVLAGGGMAGLSLACALVTGPYPNASILIVDPETKGENDRTWSFWTNNEVPFTTIPDPNEIISASWPQCRVVSHGWDRTIDMGEYRYCMIRGADFYDKVLSILESAPGVVFERAMVESIRDEDDGAVIVTDRGERSGRWVFDSRFDPAEYERRSGPHHYLKQHFTGWTIETSRPVFDPATASLFDFRTPQHGEMRFIYVLPFSPSRALVEYTLFSAEVLEREEYAQAIERYLSDVLEVEPAEYRVIDRESGLIPMTDEPVERREGRHVLAIGTRGGTVKPSTGYAFYRTQCDTAAIVDSLVRTGHPFDIPRPSRMRALDTMLLQVMYRQGELSERVFTDLFRKNPLDRLLRFLDERTTLPETLAVMASVPLFPFIRALVRTQILGKV
ncbi:MAG: lycopene cyclase family protein [Spirochaetota bacterium]